MSDINFSELAHEIGLEELAAIDRGEITSSFMPAAVVGLADGDIIAMHQPYSGRQAELYGEVRFDEGLVAKAIARTALANGMEPGPMYNFQKDTADYFTHPRSPFSSSVAQSSISIYPEAMTIDGNPLAFARSPSLVLDYGACLTGRSYIADQI